MSICCCRAWLVDGNDGNSDEPQVGDVENQSLRGFKQSHGEVPLHRGEEPKAGSRRYPTSTRSSRGVLKCVDCTPAWRLCPDARRLATGRRSAMGKHSAHVGVESFHRHTCRVRLLLLVLLLLSPVQRTSAIQEDWVGTCRTRNLTVAMGQAGS